MAKMEELSEGKLTQGRHRKYRAIQLKIKN